MRVKEKIIITMTSWHKRINNVRSVLETILNQTIQPSHIILSLCIQDFPKMTADLPEDLINFINDYNDIIEVYWFLENYKAWKKHLHALDIATDNDLIISIDDDHLYNDDFIESLYVSYVFYGKKYPVTNNKIALCHDMWCFNGPGMLYKKQYWGDYQKYLNYDVLHDVWEDTMLGVLFIANDIMILPNIFKQPDDTDLVFNEISNYTNIDRASDNYNVRLDKSNNTIIKTFDDNYYNTHEYTTTATPCIWDLTISKICKIQKKLLDAGEYIFPSMQYIFNIITSSTSILPPSMVVSKNDIESLNCNIKRLCNKSDLIGENNRVIVTIASWNKRIQNVATVLENIIYNTMPPDIIVINLARPDFGISPGKIPTMTELCSILPDDLFDMLIKYPEIQIHWYDDASIKSWKKHLYVMNEFNDDDVIICIDDDIIYSQVFIETMLKSYNLYDRKFSVTCSTKGYSRGTFSFHGSGTLYTPGFLRGNSKYINNDIIHKPLEDDWMHFMLIMHGHLILPVIGANYIILDNNFKQTDPNFGNNNFNDAWWDALHDISKEMDNMIEIEAKYRQDYMNTWTPKIYNFAYKVTQDFLLEYKDHEKKYPFNLVYNSIEQHFDIDRFGYFDDITELYKVINSYIL